MRQHHRQTVRRLVTAPLVLGVLFSAAACGGSSDQGSADSHAHKHSPSPSSASPSRSATPEKEAVLQAYRGSVDAQTEAYAQASTKGTQLTRYTTTSALAQVQKDLRSMKKASHVTTGRPQSSPRVTALDTKKEIPKAQIRDCFDVHDWKLVDKKSQKTVGLPSKRRLKYISDVELEKWGKKWLVTKTTQRDQGC